MLRLPGVWVCMAYNSRMRGKQLERLRWHLLKGKELYEKEVPTVSEKRGKGHRMMAQSKHFLLLTSENGCSTIDRYGMFWDRAKEIAHGSCAQNQTPSHTSASCVLCQSCRDESLCLELGSRGMEPAV